MVDPTALGAFTLTLEKLIDGALRYDPATRIALTRLAGKVLALESTFPPVTLYLIPQAEDADVTLAVHAYSEIPPDTRLTGSLPAVLALAFGSQHSLANSGVEVSGSTGLLAEFQDIMNHIEIDWEEPITSVLGNTLGHPMAELIRNQFNWASSRASKAQRFAGDYLTQELRAVPDANELEIFYRDVDQVRSASDRLAARIARLQAQFNSRQGD